MSLLVFISLPIALKNSKQMQQVFINTEMVVGMDGNTAKLQMIFSLLLSAGIVIETILL
jgi:1,4-dihydroxy-2-naphthoate octaprenyltransferase